MLLAAGVTAMTAIVFVAWFVAMLVKGLLAIFTYLPPCASGKRSRALPPSVSTESATFACPDPVCRSINPREAAFCRQCGRMFKRPEQA